MLDRMNPGRFRSSDEVFDYLMRFVNVEKGQATEFKLDRMRRMASDLGNPERGRLTIHVAGSKGKGSVSTMSARILAASGLKTGLYTSPHLLRWKERMTFAGEEMPEDLLLGAMEGLLPFIEGPWAREYRDAEAPTYFELTTLLAFCAFRAAGCAAQVVEVGLGGRLDSTNIVEPDVAVITPIELEHTQFLGDSIAAIAGEKAGIIKPGKPVCVSPQRLEARDVFRRRAEALGCVIHEAEACIEVSGLRVGREGTEARLRVKPGAPENLRAALGEGLDVLNPMPGAVQAMNMALACIATALVLPVSREAIVEGLASARLPARFELLEENSGSGEAAAEQPACVLDGAHTPDSVKLALDSFTALFSGPKILLFGCASDKRHAEMASILGHDFDAVIVTRPGTFKQSDPEAVYESFRKVTPHARLEPDTGTAIRKAFTLARASGASILVTGSFYLCAEARMRVTERTKPPG